MDNNNTNQAANGAAAESTSCCTHEQALKTLHTDLDAMRQLVTCKICDRLLYEPYSLSCGHTYCYSCLTQWLGSNHKKTCPDCRSVTGAPPTPSYIIREMVLVFTARTELLPDGETAEEHAKLAKEESETVAKDKADTDPRTGGLFRGCFSRRNHRTRLFPVHDPGDGLDRCPQCLWEVEDGFCNQCGVHVDGRDHLGFSDYEDSGESDDDLDHELDLEDAEAVFGADGQDYDAIDGLVGGYDGDVLAQLDPAMREYVGRYERRATSPVTVGSSDDEDDDDENSEDEDDRDLEGFVVDDESVEEVGSDEEEGGDWGSDCTETQNQPRHPRRRANVAWSISSDNDEAQVATSTLDGAESELDHSGTDSEDEGPIAPRNQRFRRPQIAVRQRRVVQSDDEGSDEDEPDESHRDHFLWSDRPGSTDYDDEASDNGHDDSVHWTDQPLSEVASTVYDDDHEEREYDSEAAYDLEPQHFDSDQDDDASEAYPSSAYDV